MVMMGSLGTNCLSASSVGGAGQGRDFSHSLSVRKYAPGILILLGKGVLPECNEQKIVARS